MLRTCFSFLRGASHPEELVARAVELGYTALAITDDATLAGVVRAHLAAKGHPLQLIIGARVEPEDAPPLLLHARNRRGYASLSRLISVGRRRAPKGEYALDLADVLDHHEGLLAVSLAGELRALGPLQDAFGDRAYLGLALHRGPDDEAVAARRLALAEAGGLPLVALGDVHYHEPPRQRLQDVLTCIRHGCTLEEGLRRGILFPNAQRALRPRAELAEVYRCAPEALARTLELAARCDFSLEELRYEYPEELVPAGSSLQEHLSRLTWEGARARYPAGIPDKVRRLIVRELGLIGELRYEPFFLTVHDIVCFAREQDILVQGRGSAANSAVCYCLGITSVDPNAIELLFERFVSRERDEPPDIDLDIEHERREEIIQYLYRRYGRDRAAIAATVISYRKRSALRDVAKVFGLGEGPLDPRAPRVALALELAETMQGLPRHASQHVGGFIITRGPLDELVPIANAAMPERTVIEWDKDDLEAMGILKVDCLGLGMLTCIHRAFRLIAAAGGPRLDLDAVPREDPAVYEMLCAADAIGVFQVESRAQLNMLPRLLPRCFYDLVVEISIVRPGPIQGGMVHPYLRRRQGREPVARISPAADRVLAKTYGVLIFQEQAMRLAIDAAGFSPDEAEALRKAMGAWRRPGTIAAFQRRFVAGAVERGIEPATAELLFQQIQGFGEYGFPESHAASFARLVYISAWLKRFYPAAFTAALLNSQPMGFYAPAQLVRDAREHGVRVLPVDVEASGWDARLELCPPLGALDRAPRRARLEPVPRGLPPERWGEPGPALRLGLRLVNGLGEAAGRAVEAARAAGPPFGSVARLARRTGLERSRLERLAEADALRSLAPSGRPEDPPAGARPRREAHFDALAEDGAELPLFAHSDPQEEPARLPLLEESGQVVADYAALGLSLRRHPLAFLRAELAARGARPLAELEHARDGRSIQVAGLVLCRQRPSTARGVLFVTLEDESGVGNLIVQPQLSERYAVEVCTARCLLARGRVEREGRVVHLLVKTLRDVSELLPGLFPSASGGRY